MDIVKVKYYSETNKSYSEREYSYLSENGLSVGDIVTVPVRDTTARAMVTAVNVPESEVAAFKDKLKVIPTSAPLFEEPVMSYEEYLEALEEDMEEGMESPIDASTYDPISPDNSVAVIRINPRDNPAIVNLQTEIVNLSNYAAFRTIRCDADLTPATDDLALIAKLKKAIKERQDEYVKPIKAHLDEVQSVFKDLLGCLEDIDKTNRDKIAAYRAGQRRRAEEAEALNRQADELARKQAEFSGTGEYTVDTTPIEAPVPVRKVSTGMGTVSTQRVWKWELVDMAQVPEEYKIIDAGKITKVVKAGLRNIPGIRIYDEETLRVSAR